MRRGRASPRTLIVTVILSMYFCSLSDAITSASINTPLSSRFGLHPFLFLHSPVIVVVVVIIIIIIIITTLLREKENDSGVSRALRCEENRATSRSPDIFSLSSEKNGNFFNEIPLNNGKSAKAREQNALNLRARNVPMALTSS